MSGPGTTFGASGGTGSVTVSVARECAWSAASQAAWIEITSNREGQGDGTIAFQVRENPDPVTRRGGITVSEQRVDVAQDAAPCRFDVQFPGAQVPSEGGQIVVQVGTHSACRWTAASQASWVTLAPDSGLGPASVQVTISPNSGALRTVNIVIAGATLAITQASPGPAPTPAPAPSPPPPQPAPSQCSYVLSPSQRTFTAAGGTGSASVTTGAGCTWTAVSSAAWVVVTSGLSGTGSGEIRYVVAPNPSTANREATITAGGVSHRVTQDGTSSSGPSVDLEGPLTGLTGTCPSLRFTIRGTVVTTDAATKFEDGNCGDLRHGLRVLVKGVRQSDGTVYAREVEMD